jgi:hypothetical protein
VRSLLLKRPSPALCLSLIALVVALGGTAYAGITLGKNSVGTKQLNDNAVTTHKIKNSAVTTKKIKDGAVTASKINASGLTVPSAQHASSADSATTANSASTLDGSAPSAFEPAANWIRTGLVTASAGQTVRMTSFGPFTLQLNCTAVGGAIKADIEATSAEANSDGYGTLMIMAGFPYKVVSTSATTTFAENDDNAADFFTPSGKTYLADLTVGQNWLSAGCFANARISPS